MVYGRQTLRRIQSTTNDDVGLLESFRGHQRSQMIAQAEAALAGGTLYPGTISGYGESTEQNTNQFYTQMALERQAPKLTNFQCPDLSPSMKKHLVRLANETANQLIKHTLEDGDPELPNSVTWKKIHTIKGIQILRGYEQNGPPDIKEVTCLRGLTDVNASIEEFAMLFRMDTNKKLAEHGMLFNPDLLDITTLYSLVQPSGDHPRRYVGIKWCLVQSPTKVFRNRDFCYLECQKEFRDANGRRGWVRSMHSIKIPGCPDLQESHGVVRGSLYRCGLIAVESDTPGVLNTTYTIEVDLKGHFPEIFQLRFLSKRIAVLATINKYCQQQRLSSSPLLGDLDIPESSLKSSCAFCYRVFTTFYKRLVCRKCGQAVCRNCSDDWLLDIPVMGRNKVRICTVCSAESRTAHISPAMEAFMNTPELDSMSSAVKAKQRVSARIQEPSFPGEQLDQSRRRRRSLSQPHMDHQLPKRQYPEEQMHDSFHSSSRNNVRTIRPQKGMPYESKMDTIRTNSSGVQSSRNDWYDNYDNSTRAEPPKSRRDIRNEHFTADFTASQRASHEHIQRSKSSDSSNPRYHNSPNYMNTPSQWSPDFTQSQRSQRSQRRMHPSQYETEKIRYFEPESRDQQGYYPKSQSPPVVYANRSFKNQTNHRPNNMPSHPRQQLNHSQQYYSTHQHSTQIQQASRQLHRSQPMPQSNRQYPHHQQMPQARGHPLQSQSMPVSNRQYQQSQTVSHSNRRQNSAPETNSSNSNYPPELELFYDPDNPSSTPEDIFHRLRGEHSHQISGHIGRESLMHEQNTTRQRSRSHENDLNNRMSSQFFDSDQLGVIGDDSTDNLPHSLPNRHTQTPLHEEPYQFDPERTENARSRTHSQDRHSTIQTSGQNSPPTQNAGESIEYIESDTGEWIASNPNSPTEATFSQSMKRMSASELNYGYTDTQDGQDHQSYTNGSMNDYNRSSRSSSDGKIQLEASVVKGNLDSEDRVQVTVDVDQVIPILIERLSQKGFSAMI